MVSKIVLCMLYNVCNVKCIFISFHQYYHGAVVAGPVAGVTQDTAITTIVIRTVAGTRENLAQYYFINPPTCDICHSPDLDQIPFTIQDYVFINMSDKVRLQVL